MNKEVVAIITAVILLIIAVVASVFFLKSKDTPEQDTLKDKQGIPFEKNGIPCFYIKSRTGKLFRLVKRHTWHMSSKFVERWNLYEHSKPHFCLSKARKKQYESNTK